MRNRLTSELAVCGFNAVQALGQYHPETVNRLFLREDRLPEFSKLCKLLAERKNPYKLCGDEELERICKSNRHQGIVAMIEEPQVPELSREDVFLWAREGWIGLVLHSVGNDHNLGAMVRSAAFFDAHFVVISGADTEARLTTSAYRVAEGGMEHVVFRKCRDTLAFLKAAGALTTFGAEPRARLRLQDVPAILRRRSGGVAVVLGNEEKGLPQDVKDRCSALVRIPGTGKLESLNVAQAATLFLHEFFQLR
jgi:TrmH RNA methyltransferase